MIHNKISTCRIWLIVIGPVSEPIVYPLDLPLRCSEPNALVKKLHYLYMIRTYFFMYIYSRRRTLGVKILTPPCHLMCILKDISVLVKSLFQIWKSSNYFLKILFWEKGETLTCTNGSRIFKNSSNMSWFFNE